MTAVTDDAVTRLPTKVGSGVTKRGSVLPSKAVCGTWTEALAVGRNSREPPNLIAAPAPASAPIFIRSLRPRPVGLVGSSIADPFLHLVARLDGGLTMSEPEQPREDHGQPDRLAGQGVLGG